MDSRADIAFEHRSDRRPRARTHTSASQGQITTLHPTEHAGARSPITPIAASTDYRDQVKMRLSKVSVIATSDSKFPSSKNCHNAKAQ